MDILLKNYNFYNMSSIAILFSGHLRNILNHIHNLQINLLNILSDNSIHYDIYIHTWDSNITNDTIDWGAKDQYYNNNINNIIKILKTKIKIKKILIENQNKKNIENQINSIMKFDINKRDRDRNREMLQKSYFQYYGFYKSLKLIDNLNDYNYIIKTRPDTYYLEKFNINLLNKDLVFPNSQLQNNTNIKNQITDNLIIQNQITDNLIIQNQIPDNLIIQNQIPDNLIHPYVSRGDFHNLLNSK
jgi:hypothetical protein